MHTLSLWSCVQEIEAIKARVKEMEEEAEKLKEMQGEVEKQMMSAKSRKNFQQWQKVSVIITGNNSNSE